MVFCMASVVLLGKVQFLLNPSVFILVTNFLLHEKQSYPLCQELHTCMISCALKPRECWDRLIGWIMEGQIIKPLYNCTHACALVLYPMQAVHIPWQRMSGGLIWNSCHQNLSHLNCEMTNEIVQCIIKHCYITKVQWLPSITLRFVDLVRRRDLLHQCSIIFTIRL